MSCARFMSLASDFTEGFGNLPVLLNLGKNVLVLGKFSEKLKKKNGK